MTFADISPAVSVIALLVSLFTAWFTIFRRGTVRSTHPSFVSFSYDFSVGKEPWAKVFLRTLIFSTGKRGQVIESLFLRVREGSRTAEFSFWGYGDKDLIRGSGLFIPESGLATNHHFNPINRTPLFLFSAGTYTLELVAKLVGQSSLVSLCSVELEVKDSPFGSAISRDAAIYFNWSAEQQRYIASNETRSGQVHALSDPRTS
ncbi:hypothetical protein [Polaromonas sp. A23]|uniref:hypothetical protein n=1 Tax=Polaromonas sp. A23 TaxID=1944133 RepID=UPI0009851639|nr:hypothetical protein [Polaromonas sp. A23]OOG46595.1 hypothetical protein B0B52_02895 [Polaromonas sp. A23]